MSVSSIQGKMLLDIKLSCQIPGLRKNESPALPGCLTHSRADHLIRKENISKSVWDWGDQEGQRLLAAEKSRWDNPDTILPS